MRFKALRRNLRISILTAFSALLFLSFALAGAAFNITINQYIRSGAIDMLDEARAGQYNILELLPPENPLLWFMGRQPNLFRANLGSFVIDNNYRPLNRLATDSAHDIAEMLRQNETIPSTVHNLRLRTQNHTYFITSATAFPGDLERYTIFYVNITDLQRFTRSVNLLLFYLACLIWLLAVVVTGFLAGSLARPLHILQNFAKRIGSGDFTPNAISFTSEEFEALNQSLNHTAKQLAKYDNDQKTFFQNVSHELRTPLMTIESYAEGIKYGIMDPVKSAQTILDATGRLSDMVGDILYISRIDNITVPTMEQTDLNILIQEHINLQRPLAESKDLTIIFEPTAEPIIINCAVSYMGRAMDNLISNALRFAESIITVQCRRVGDRVLIQVTDDGPGFEPEILPHVFERFYKGKNGLTGIGLSVVRSIIEQHKGTATAENGDIGAKLTISLPGNL